MKNKFLIFLIYFLTISLNVIAEESKFEVKDIKITNNGNSINASNGKFITADGELEIVAKKFLYNKKEKILDVFKGTSNNKLDNLEIIFDKSTYNEKNFILTAQGNIKINDSINNLKIESEIITIDRKKNYGTIAGLFHLLQY